MIQRRIGVTVGKFNPPHLGHLFLIETAAELVHRLYVIVGDRSDQTISASDRARWIETDAPTNVSVLITPDDLPAENGSWAQRALAIMPEAPNVAFTSEPWGPQWAALMDCEHVAVDDSRARNPISGTQIREDLRAGFDQLVPAARAGLARRVVTAGAESTGKSTLAAALAERFATVLVPEYGRSYWEGRRYLADQPWRSREFRHIASTHHNVEAELARSACNGLVVLDTDALVTSVWHERYTGSTDDRLDAIAAGHRPSLYLICAPDFDWVQDGTRESADQRRSMHRRTLELVGATGVPFEILRGDRDERLRQASKLIEGVTSFEPLT